MNQAGYGIIKRPHVTATIPVYNEEDCIEDCITSLLKQDFEPLEILAGDDGSVDNSARICENLKIRVLRGAHKGMGAVRNVGARNANGNILVLVDADMVFAPDYVSRLVAPIIRGEAIAPAIGMKWPPTGIIRGPAAKRGSLGDRTKGVSFLKFHPICMCIEGYKRSFSWKAAGLRKMRVEGMIPPSLGARVFFQRQSRMPSVITGILQT